jgi:hypothetical protein
MPVLHRSRLQIFVLVVVLRLARSAAGKRFFLTARGAFGPRSTSSLRAWHNLTISNMILKPTDRHPTTTVNLGPNIPFDTFRIDLL